MLECVYNSSNKRKGPWDSGTVPRADGKPLDSPCTSILQGVEGKTLEEMGYQNAQAVYDISRTGRLAKKRGENLTVYAMAQLVLGYMAINTYDWDRARNQPPEKLRKANAPCRYYTLGWRAIADAYGMILLTPEQAMSENADKEIEKRENTIRKNISNAWLFLQERGVIKKLEPASLGKNAGFLLLLGDDEENLAVERWARQCLNLPMVW